MNLTRPLEDFVQIGWTVAVALKRFLLPGFRTTESGVDCRVFWVVVIVLALVFIAAELAVAVLNLRGACLAGSVFGASQPAILTRAKAGHECHEGCHRFWLFSAEVAGDPFVTDAMFKGR